MKSSLQKGNNEGAKSCNEGSKNGKKKVANVAMKVSQTKRKNTMKAIKKGLSTETKAAAKQVNLLKKRSKD